MPRIHRTCKDCQREFFVGEKAQAYFLERGLETPVRCWDCRQARRLEREMREHDEWRENHDGQTSDDGR
jgi:hypothetical protein